MADIDCHYESKLMRKSAVRYVLPAMLGLVFGQLSPMVGGICIAQSLGEVPFSALSTVEPINLIFNAIGALGGVGCGITVSKCSGSGDRELAARTFSRTLVSLAIVAITLSAVMAIFADPILRFLRATPENIDYARQYLYVLLAGSISTVFFFAGDYIITDDNNPRLVLIANISAAVINVLGNFVGLEVLHLGIGASAGSMMFSNLVACVILSTNLRRKDSLCRFVPPRKHEDDPSLLSLLRPGTPMALMYLMFTVQMLVQNFVLEGESGTSGLGNSAVVDNLTLFLTIFTASASEPIMAMASSYFGEGNRCGVLMVKRMMFHLGMALLLPVILILILFPQLFMAIFAVNDPVMLESLPFAIRIVCLSALLTFTNDSLVNFLSATGREHIANYSYGIQTIVNIAVTILLARSVPMDAPWYGTLIANACACTFLITVGKLARGFVKFYPENVLMMTGGHASREQVDEWERQADEVLTSEQLGLVRQGLLEPFLASAAVDEKIPCSFTVLARDNGDTAAILRCDMKHDPLGSADTDEEPDEDELSHVYGTCVSSEFNTLRRLMINFAA